MSAPGAACDDAADALARRDRAAGAVAGGFAVRRRRRPPLRLGPRGMVDLEGRRGGRTDTLGDGPRRPALRRPWLGPSRTRGTRARPPPRRRVVRDPGRHALPRLPLAARRRTLLVPRSRTGRRDLHPPLRTPEQALAAERAVHPSRPSKRGSLS